MTKRYAVHVTKDRIVSVQESQTWEWYMPYAVVFRSYSEMLADGTLTQAEGALLMRLIDQMDKNNLVLMTDAVISTQFEIGYDHTRGLIHKLIRAGTLYRLGKGKLFVNPGIAHRTSFANWKELFEQWQNLPIKKSKTSQESGIESA